MTSSLEPNSFVALITGSGRGIGAATALDLARSGASVVLTSRTMAELKEVAGAIEREFGPNRTLTVAGDLADPAFIQDLFRQTLGKFGRLDALVNNAAAAAISPLESIRVEEWDRLFALNVRAVMLCCQEAFAIFRKQGGGGSIVNISSLAGISGTTKFGGFCAYSATKFSVVGLSECLAAEGKEDGIRVNCVAPGAVDTAMLRQAAPFLKTKTQPADVAQTVAFLADPRRSGPITGSVVAIHSNL